MTRARASGKVILLGEHAVVYGVPALAAGIDRGVEARAEKAARASVSLGGRRAEAGDGSELGQALEALLSSLESPPLEVSATLELPAGSGLGVSAALGVAIARAALGAMGEPPERARVLAAAGAWEGVFHGAPSGIDAAVAESGGTIEFVRGEPPQRVVLGCDVPLVIALAGPPESTRLMVESVARLRERRPSVVEKSFEAIHSLVRNARHCLESGDLPALGRLMDFNQMLLAGLMVSTEGIERACDVARRAGALGAKLTGAGGGGAVVALAGGDSTPLVDAFRSAGIESFAATVHAGTAP